MSCTNPLLLGCLWSAGRGTGAHCASRPGQRVWSRRLDPPENIRNTPPSSGAQRIKYLCASHQQFYKQGLSFQFLTFFIPSSARCKLLRRQRNRPGPTQSRRQCSSSRPRWPLQSLPLTSTGLGMGVSGGREINEGGSAVSLLSERHQTLVTGNLTSKGLGNLSGLNTRELPTHHLISAGPAALLSHTTSPRKAWPCLSRRGPRAACWAASGSKRRASPNRARPPRRRSRTRCGGVCTLVCAEAALAANNEPALLPPSTGAHHRSRSVGRGPHPCAGPRAGLDQGRRVHAGAHGARGARARRPRPRRGATAHGPARCGDVTWLRLLGARVPASSLSASSFLPPSSPLCRQQIRRSCGGCGRRSPCTAP